MLQMFLLECICTFYSIQITWSQQDIFFVDVSYKCRKFSCRQLFLFFSWRICSWSLFLFPMSSSILCKGGYWATLWVMGHWAICGYVRAGHGHRTAIRTVIYWTWDLSFLACHRLSRACSRAFLAWCSTWNYETKFLKRLSKCKL